MPARSKSEKATRVTTHDPLASIPPVAAALARYADPDGERIPEAFAEAWAQMPAMMRALATGTAGCIGETDHNSIVNARLDRMLAQPRSEYDLVGPAFDWMEETNVDMRAAVVAPITHDAFFVGVAFAAYVLLTGGAR